MHRGKTRPDSRNGTFKCWAFAVLCIHSGCEFLLQTKRALETLYRICAPINVVNSTKIRQNVFAGTNSLIQRQIIRHQVDTIDVQA